jgi:hypothetical protein
MLSSLYPLYPPAIGESVDRQRMSALALHQQPDLLVLPSKLSYFCKVIYFIVADDYMYININHSIHSI